MVMINKMIGIRIEQELWSQDNIPQGDFSEVMRTLLDEHIEKTEKVKKALEGGE